MSPLPATLRACLKSYPRTRVHASPCGRAGKPTKTAGSTSKNSTCDLAQPLDSAGGRVRPGRLGVAAPADSESTGWPSMANLLCEPAPRHRQASDRNQRGFTKGKSRIGQALESRDFECVVRAPDAMNANRA